MKPELEPIRAVDDQGELVGIMTRHECRERRLAAEGIVLYLFDLRGRILMQLRSPRQAFGGMWDASVTGHRSPEDLAPAETVLREAQEELGLVLDPSCLVYMRSTLDLLPSNGGVIRQFAHRYALCLDLGAPGQEICPDPMEVAGVEFFPGEHLLADLRTGSRLTVPRPGLAMDIEAVTFAPISSFTVS